MKYLNKSKDVRQMIIKWACMNQDIKVGDSLVCKTILLNIEKMNSCIFYPIKDDLVVIDCVFIGSSENTNKADVQLFNRMRDKDILSIIL